MARELELCKMRMEWQNDKIEELTTERDYLKEQLAAALKRNPDATSTVGSSSTRAGSISGESCIQASSSSDTSVDNSAESSDTSSSEENKKEEGEEEGEEGEDSEEGKERIKIHAKSAEP
ncbi:hypothetical protein NL108_018672 [Boleophthalmus pectinirostris]|nr:hypothetical protein NL108_018672 [Boleophthalmus pectinirostris]